MILAAVRVEEKGLREGLSPFDNLREEAKLRVIPAELILLPWVS